MSQTIKCPSCGELIDVDEQIRKDAEEKIRNEYNEKEKKKLENALRKELKPQIENEVKNSVKFEHDKELQKEKTKTSRMGEDLKKANKALAKTQESLDKAQRPIDQGSPELDGEVQEIVLENYLRKRFLNDVFTPVPKGKPGADTIQEIMHKNISCGKVLWESKTVKNFSEKWVEKLLDDMSVNNIGLGVLATEILPKKMKEKFEFRENKKIIICKFDETLDVVSEMVRQLALTVNIVKNQGTKNPDKSQNELWQIFNSETFIIEFRSLLKTAIQEKSQIEKDKSNDDKSYKKRIALWNDRKDHLANIVRTLSQVEGTKMTTNLIQIQDGIEDIDDE